MLLSLVLVAGLVAGITWLVLSRKGEDQADPQATSSAQSSSPAQTPTAEATSLPTEPPFRVAGEQRFGDYSVAVPEGFRSEVIQPRTNQNRIPIVRLVHPERERVTFGFWAIEGFAGMPKYDPATMSALVLCDSAIDSYTPDLQPTTVQTHPPEYIRYEGTVQAAICGIRGTLKGEQYQRDFAFVAYFNPDLQTGFLLNMQVQEEAFDENRQYQTWFKYYMCSVAGQTRATLPGCHGR